MIVLVVTTISTIFALSMDGKVLAEDNNVVTQPGYLLTVNVSSHPFGTSAIGISITTENGYTDQANIPTAGNPSWTFNIPPNQGNSVQVCVNSGALSEENCHIYKTTGSAMSVSLPAVSGNSSGSGNNNSNIDNNDGNKNNNSHHHDSGTTNNRSNDNNHSSNHHNSNTDISNSNVDNNRSSRHSSGSGFNENQGSSFDGTSSSAGSNAHQRNSHGFNGSGNDNPGSNNHHNSSSSNNAGVPMIQFIGPI